MPKVILSLKTLLEKLREIISCRNFHLVEILYNDESSPQADLLKYPAHGFQETFHKYPQYSLEAWRLCRSSRLYILMWNLFSRLDSYWLEYVCGSMIQWMKEIGRGLFHLQEISAKFSTSVEMYLRLDDNVREIWFLMWFACNKWIHNILLVAIQGIFYPED